MPFPMTLNAPKVKQSIKYIHVVR